MVLTYAVGAVERRNTTNLVSMLHLPDISALTAVVVRNCQKTGQRFVECKWEAIGGRPAIRYSSGRSHPPVFLLKERSAKKEVESMEP